MLTKQSCDYVVCEFLSIASFQANQLTLGFIGRGELLLFIEPINACQHSSSIRR